MKKTLFSVLGIIFALTIVVLSSCQKEYEPDPLTPLPSEANGFAIKSSLGQGDTIYGLPGTTFLLWIQSPPLTTYAAVWNISGVTANSSNISPPVTGQLNSGVHNITATVTSPGLPTTFLSAVFVIAEEQRVIFVSSQNISGSTYRYKFAIDQSLMLATWHVGDASSWVPFTNPISATDTIHYKGKIWRCWYVNYTDGQFTNDLVKQSVGDNSATWLTYTQSIYWHSSDNLLYTYLRAGKVYTAPPTPIPGTYPGSAGDPINTSTVPTWRVSTSLGATSQTDTLVLFFNNDYSTSNPKPFGKTSMDYFSSTWTLQPQAMIVGTNWGFIKVSLAYILSHGNYFSMRFGGDYNNASQYANMSHSPSYNVDNNSLLIQVVGPINATAPDRNYVIKICE